MLELKNVFKSFKNIEILKNANIVFEYGCIYGLIGENGAGKTTIF